MSRHPRTIAVIQAKIDLTTAIYNVAEKHKLTDSELLQCLNDYMSSTLRMALRIERHGSIEIGADEPPVARRKRRKPVQS